MCAETEGADNYTKYADTYEGPCNLDMCNKAVADVFSLT